VHVSSIEKVLKGRHGFNDKVYNINMTAISKALSKIHPMIYTLSATNESGVCREVDKVGAQ
jgi:hypothetical protein